MKLVNNWKGANWRPKDDMEAGHLPVAPWISLEIGKLKIFWLSLDFYSMQFEITIFNICLKIFDYGADPKGKEKQFFKFRLDRGWNKGLVFLVSLAIEWKIFYLYIGRDDFKCRLAYELQLFGFSLES